MSTNRTNSDILYSNSNFYLGLGLAVSSSVFIGSSFIIKKKALVRLNRKGGHRAGAGGFGYLTQWLWWAGFMLMGVGELANFTAYAFAPASLVTPLGAISVIVAAVLSSHFLKERLNILGKLGCLLCVLGSTVIVIHSPKEDNMGSLSELIEKLKQPSFIAYVLFVIIISLLIVFYYGPKYGNHNVIVYVTLCSAIGSLTVMSCKGLGLSIRENLFGQNDDPNYWTTYAFLITVAACIIVQINYLNRALDIFSTSIVTPVYYVMFTTLVIIASSILFQEWTQLCPQDIVASLCGFLVVISGIILLNAFKDLDITLNDVRVIFRPKRDIIATTNCEGYLVASSRRKTFSYGTNVL